MKVSSVSNLGPSFSALLACPQVMDLRATVLIGAILRLYPAATVAGWGGSGQVAQGEHGIFISVDGVDIGIIHRRFAAPLLAFDSGNYPHIYWTGAQKDLAAHQSHIFVIEAAFGEVSKSIARANAVTMVTDAITSLMPVMGVMWETAWNLLPARHFAGEIIKFRAGGFSVPLWVRTINALQPAAQTCVIGTLGLRCFGSPEIEIHASRLGNTEAISAALSYARSRLMTGPPTSNEASMKISIEGLAKFQVELLAEGLLGIGAVEKLTEIEPSRVEAAPTVRIPPFRTAADRISAENVGYNELMGQVVRGIRNAFYAKPKETWDQARLESPRQLDAWFKGMEAQRKS